MDYVLKHHGIKGQKWGVRNGPPYPLNAEAQKRMIRSLINNEMNRWDYGAYINGKKVTDISKIDWSKYRTIPVDKLKTLKIGTCWDFVNYQNAICKSYGVDTENYMVAHRYSDNPDDMITHTFTVANIGNKKYWLESAKWNDRGVHEIKTYKDVIDHFVSSKYIEPDKYPYSVFSYNPEGMDNYLTDQEYFEKATQRLVEKG